MNFHRDVLAAHAQFGGDLESMQKCYDWYDQRGRIATLEAELAKAREAALEEAAKVAHDALSNTSGFVSNVRRERVTTAIRALSQDKEE